MQRLVEWYLDIALQPFDPWWLMWAQIEDVKISMVVRMTVRYWWPQLEGWFLMGYGIYGFLIVML
jgi:hypothetical protein